MHAGEVEVARIGADLMAGDLAEADEPQRARPAGVVLQPDAPAEDRALRIGAEFHRRAQAVDRIADAEAVEADPLDVVVAGAARRRPADRPRRVAVLAEIEEMAALLQRIERAAEEVDRESRRARRRRRRRRRARRASVRPRPSRCGRQRLAAAPTSAAGAPAGGGTGVPVPAVSRERKTSASAVAPAATPATP